MTIRVQKTSNCMTGSPAKASDNVDCTLDDSAQPVAISGRVLWQEWLEPKHTVSSWEIVH